ncbi:hypothetical protein CLU79DRAFT_730659 [Phycomyces nitens]|nr:hypothetical protein CLU79DRAFT_730659 [Phycomyces nitens]
MSTDYIPGFLCLTPDDEDNAPYYEYPDEEDCPTWMDDCEVQENLFQIIPLTPEESRIDKDNHIVQSNPCYYFFEELGYFTEEPEPIDPTRDYDAEAQQLIQERNRTRQKHIDISSTPSLASSRSGLSSTSSSIHHHDDGRFHHYQYPSDNKTHHRPPLAPLSFHCL